MEEPRNNQGIEVQKHYTASLGTCALGGIVSGTDESSIFK